MNIIMCGPNEIDETCGMGEPVRSLPDTEQPEVDWNDIAPLVEQCAKRTTWKYRKYVELEDVQQTAWLYYFENQKILDALPRDTYGLMFIRRRIQSACNTYALKEMCAKTGVQWEDQYRYGTGEIRFLIQLNLAGGLQGGENSDQIAGYLDVRQAMGSLNDVEYQLLSDHYSSPNTEDDALSSTERGRIHRVVRKIQDVLNGITPP